VLPARRPNGWLRAIVAVLALLAVWQFGQAAYIAAKARLAQVLIASAWERARSGQAAPRPWPWADTTPVAKLSVPARGLALYVLADASGRTLAFGPGQLSGSAQPGRGGNTVISGHRDTHFAFLEHAVKGEELVLELPDRSVYRYRIAASAVVRETDMGVVQDRGEEVLTLLTCYPFHAVRARGPLRYVVTAERV
jgi:sortase A